MKVEFLRPVAGLAYFEGDEAELNDDRARLLIEAGFCVASKGSIYPTEDKPETAESTGPLTAENAMVKTAKGKGKR
jgi:hypothetical protein